MAIRHLASCIAFHMRLPLFPPRRFLVSGAKRFRSGESGLNVRQTDSQMGNRGACFGHLVSGNYFAALGVNRSEGECSPTMTIVPLLSPAHLSATATGPKS